MWGVYRTWYPHTVWIFTILTKCRVQARLLRRARAEGASLSVMGFFGESNSEAVPPFLGVGRPAPRPSTGPSGGSPRGDPPCKMWRGSNGTAPFGPITSQYGGYFVLSNFYFLFYRAPAKSLGFSARSAAPLPKSRTHNKQELTKRCGT